MARKAKAFIGSCGFYIETDIPERKAVPLNDDAIDDFLCGWAQYAEDRKERLIYLYEPFLSTKGIDESMKCMRQCRRKAFFETFSKVMLFNDDDSKLIDIIRNSNLFEIFQYIRNIVRLEELDYKKKNFFKDFYEIDNILMTLEFFGTVRPKNEILDELLLRLDDKLKERDKLSACGYPIAETFRFYKKMMTVEEAIDRLRKMIYRGLDDEAKQS